jgi:PAS domain S-box-containing protein
MPDKENQEKANILIVDDKATNIFALEEVLSRPDRHFIRAMNGKEALKIVLDQAVDLIILDVQMPDMDGFEVAKILKSHKRTRDIPIIFASAEKKEHRFMMKGFEEGAVDYLYKPLDAAVTAAKVSVLLELHLRKKELVAKNLLLERYALLINNSADVICIINARTLKFEEVNSAVEPILGYTAAEMKNSSILSYLEEEDRLAVKSLAGTDISKFSFETRVFCKDGTTRWLNWNVVDKDGFWFANARDITQQKNTDREIRQLNADLKDNITLLEEANKELGAFSYSISHDLRTPLRSISGYSRIILEDHQAQLNDEVRRLLGNIQDNAVRMGMLIDHLLEFSRLGRRKPVKMPVDLTEMAHRVVRELEEGHQAKAIVRIGILPLAEGDPVLLYQVLVNLVSNAIKYSGKKQAPEIEIGASENGGEIVYYVKDNGVGFNMEYAHKLFGVFQRLHGNDEFEGTGVGLAIVQRIIAKHGGRVWAEGRPGEGATFFFSLPRPITRKIDAT